MLCHTSFVSLLQVLQRFLRVGGVPRDVFKDYKARERNLDKALTGKNLLQVTSGVYAVHTFSAASHELSLIAVASMAHRSTPHMSAASHWCRLRCTGRQPPLRRAGDFATEQLEFRSLYAARKIWDWVQSPYRQDLCVELITCVAVSRWLVCNARGQDVLVRSITCCDCRLDLLNI